MPFLDPQWTVRHARMAGWAVSAIVGLGCGSANRFEPVSGTVQYADGTAVAGGVVEFKPFAAAGPSARGAIGPDGRFDLKTGSIAGVRPGRYRIAVVHVEEAEILTHHHTPRVRVHPRFARFETSGLVQEIEPGIRNAPCIVIEPLQHPTSR